MKNTIVKKSAIAGKGIFATRNLKKGQIIFTIKGPTIVYPFVPDVRTGMDWLNIGPNKWKIAYKDNPWRYINHSCSPNAGLKATTKVISTRNIKEGEEITIDYSCTEASMSGWKMRMACGCKTTVCRKTIRSIQYLSEDLYHKYEPFIPAFLKKEYERQKVYTEKGKTGVFAKRKIKKDETIFEVVGPMVTYPKPPDYKIGFKWLGVGKNTWIMPLRQNPWSSIRHSCSPNVGIKGKTKIVAMRDIAPKEEIMIDDSITEADPNWHVICKCKNKTCRKVIRSIQYLPRKLFDQYVSYIPVFFQKVYMAYHHS